MASVDWPSSVTGAGVGARGGTTWLRFVGWDDRGLYVGAWAHMVGATRQRRVGRAGQRFDARGDWCGPAREARGRRLAARGLRGGRPVVGPYSAASRDGTRRWRGVAPVLQRGGHRLDALQKRAPGVPRVGPGLVRSTVLFRRLL